MFRVNLYTFFILSVVVVGVFGQDVPKVEIETPEDFDFSNGSFALITNTFVKILFICDANYPIEWIIDYGQYEEGTSETKIMDVKRNFTNFWNESSYTYRATLKIDFPSKVYYESRYFCRNTENPKLVTVLQHTLENNAKLMKFFIIPKPSKSNTLLKIYSPVNLEGECDHTISVQPIPDEGFPEDEPILGKPQWVCRNKFGNKTDIDFYQCNTAMKCNSDYQNINKGTKCLKILNSTDSCKGCTEKVSNQKMPGFLTCDDGGVNLAQFYFSSVRKFEENTSWPKTYYDWYSADPEEMMMIDPLDHEIIYLGQDLTVKCHISLYYFSLGFGFAKLDSNDNYTFHIVDEFETDDERAVYTFNWTTKIESLTEREIFCIAPIWNSTKWTNSSVKLSISDDLQKVQILEKPEKNEIFAYLERGSKNQTIRCSGVGRPKPEFSWDYENSEFIKIQENYQEGWSQLIFSEISETIVGKYICTASNFHSSDSKTFNLAIKDSSLNLAVIFGSTITFFIILISMIMIISWRIIKKQKEKIRSLTEEEIKEFIEGNPQDMDKDGAINPQSIPYHNEYEIPKEKLDFNTSNVLGSGQFGKVFQGSMEVLNEKTEIAVKTVNPNLDVSFFKAFLMEIKIMAYLGKHERIVSLLGACTQNIKNRDIYIAIELCPNGSLKDYLRQNREHFQNILRNFEIEPEKENEKNLTERYVNVNTVGDKKNFKIYTTFDLCRWSYEIAQGMEFIASKRIIHGDLATRNILLTSNRSIKISDFGLSRQLCNYTNYVKKTQCPLPWKWMAIESLKDFMFSEKSDTWAYGITIWEIFTLGEDPYPGEVWTQDFIRQLSDGLRNLKSPYSTPEMYDQMTKCWNQEPKARPSFTELKLFFYNKIEHLLPKTDEYTILAPEEPENDIYTTIVE